MLKFFINMVIGLVVINIIYGLVPEHGYNKYIKLIAGIMIMLFIFGNVGDIELENSFYGVGEEIPVYENKEYRETVNRQLEEAVSENIEKSINDSLNTNTTVDVIMDNNQITNITVYLNGYTDKKSIINFLHDTYNLDVGRITVEQ